MTRRVGRGPHSAAAAPPPALQAQAAALDARLRGADEGDLVREAQALCDAAIARAAACRAEGREPAGDEAFGWLRQRSQQLWHAWGSCATSGGDGFARSQEIDAATEAMARAARPPERPALRR